MCAKSIVITGCSSGFGRITALHLAQAGWRVFATFRTDADAAAVMAEARTRGADTCLVPVQCDVTQAEDVAALARTVGAATSTLDALVNNAGMAYPAPLELQPLADVRAQFELNVIAQLGVTQALLPLLKAARGMILNVSSQGGRVVLPVTGAYCASKYALEALSDALRVELAPFGVRVVVLEPGSSPTAIWEKGRKLGEAALGGGAEQAGDYQPLVSLIMDQALAKQAGTGFPPQLFADTVFKILNSPNPGTRYPIGDRAQRMILLRTLLPDKWWDAVVRRMLKW